MYSNEKNFTEEPFEDNGRYKIHPLSSEGIENYLSKDSYNYNYIKTKKNPELLKQIEEEIKAEKALKEKLENQNNTKTENINENKQEDLKEDNKNTQNNNTSNGKEGNKSKNKKGKKPNMNKNCNNNYNAINNKGKINKEKKKSENLKRKQSPGQKLANSIAKSGKISGPVISNVNNDRGKLWEYPNPYHA